MLKWAKSVLNHCSWLKVGFFDGALDPENNATTHVTIFDIFENKTVFGRCDDIRQTIPCNHAAGLSHGPHLVRLELAQLELAKNV